MKAYPKYKDSGTPWLGKIPEHWEAIKMKHLFKERVEKGYADEPLLAATQTKGVVPKSMFENKTVEAQKDLHLLKLVEPGDFVISLRSFQGGIEHAYYRGIISPAYTVMIPQKRILPEYYRHLAKSKEFISLLQTCVTGIREGQNINYELLKRSPIPIPPQSEQQQIVRYLDWQTTKINKFIKAKKKLIALLKEQKQNIINEAVTKGINPDVKMKDSGVEWLGEIPEHWKCVSLRHKYHQCLGKMLDSKKIIGKYLVPYLRNTDVQWDHINTKSLPNMDIRADEYERYTVQNGDLLVCEGGEIGRCAIWADDGKVCGFQKALHRLRPVNANKDIPRYMYYALNAAAKFGAFNDGHVSTIAHLTGDKLRAHRFGFPPKGEQQEIVDFLDKETALIDKAISRAQREIELIQEYRTRLVSDVVTGKIDVRSVEIPEFQPVEADWEVPENEEPGEESIAEEIQE